MTQTSPDRAPLSIQVVVDCQNAHELADWWAETLGWRVEPQDESFIRSMIDQGLATEADTTVHRGAMVWRGASAIGPAAATGSGQPRMLFQEVPESKAVKNRIHVDLRHDPDSGLDLAAFRQSLLDRGATEVGGGQQGPHRWVTMADPEGNEFCVDL